MNYARVTFSTLGKLLIVGLVMAPGFLVSGQTLPKQTRPFHSNSTQIVVPRVCTEVLSQGFQAGGARDYFWKKPEVSVRFLNGDSSLKDKVRHYASLWNQYASLRFNFVTTGNTEIRITFKRTFSHNGQQKTDVNSWSMVGTDALSVTDQNAPTMNFGWLDSTTSEEEFRRVALHEFGHALGLIHEHQSPVANIRWNRAAVYNYYINSLGWTKSRVDYNVFGRYNATTTQFTAYDPDSIMHYAIPAEFIEPGEPPVEWNSDLSENDKFFISSKYPAVTLSLHRRNGSSESSIEPDEIPLRLKTGTQFSIRLMAPFETYLYSIGYDSEASYLMHPLSRDQASTRLSSGVPLKLDFRISGKPGNEGIILIFSPTKLESPGLMRMLTAADGKFDADTMRLSALRSPLPVTHTVGAITSLNCSYISQWISEVFELSCNKFEQTQIANTPGFRFAVGGGLGKPVILRVAYIHERAY